MYKFNTEATKFVIVGAATFVLTLVVFIFMLRIMKINYLLSLVATWVIGVLFSYVLNFSWVFKPEQKLAFRGRLFKYIAAGLLSISLNLLALYYVVEHTGFDPFYVQMVLLPIFVVFNFSTAKLWSLRQNKQLHNDI